MIIEVTYEKGSSVFEAGTHLEDFIFIIEGQLTYLGRKFGSNSFFLPLEGVLGIPLKGSVVAEVDSICLLFRTEDLSSLAEQRLEVYQSFLKAFLSVWAKMLRVHERSASELAADAFAYFKQHGKPSYLMKSARLVLELVRDPTIVDQALSVIQRAVEGFSPQRTEQLPDDENVAYALVLASLSTDENPLDWMYYVFSFSAKFRDSERSAELLNTLLEKVEVLGDRSAVETTVSVLMLHHPDSKWTARALMSYSRFLKNRGVPAWQDEVLRVLIAFPDSKEASEAEAILRETLMDA